MTKTFENAVNPLTYDVPIVTSRGTPTVEFQRKWAQQQQTNATIPDLTSAAAVSSALDLLGSPAASGNLLIRGSSAWFAKAMTGDATIDSTGAIVVTKSNGTAFGSAAFQPTSAFDPAGAAAAVAALRASTGTFGLVEVDGTTITSAGGVISATGGGGGGPSPANPTATASDTAVNGTATTYMRSDAAPAVQLASASVFGLVKVDGTTITESGGVISAAAAVSGANPTATASDVAVNGSATTYMRSDAAPAVQKGTNAVFGIVKVDGTTITSAAGVISAVAPTVPTGANPTATASDTAVNGTATTFMRSDAAPAVQKASSSVFGLVKVDGTTITASGGVISAVGGGGGAVGANPTATGSDTAVNGVATTFMRSDAAPAIQKTSASVFGLCKVDGTTITASSGVISAVKPTYTQPTSQTFLTAGSISYTTPANCVRIEVEIKGAGGGAPGNGTASSGSGTAGGDTIFNSIHATGGSAGHTNGSGGAGGAAGAGLSLFSYSGIGGGLGLLQVWNTTDFIAIGGNGGGNGGGVATISGSGAAGGNAATNSGAGGSGPVTPHNPLSTLGNWQQPGAGGEGQRRIVVINSPAATYTGTVGAKGTGGTAGVSGFAGGNGADGYIIVREFYV